MWIIFFLSNRKFPQNNYKRPKCNNISDKATTAISSPHAKHNRKGKITNATISKLQTFKIPWYIHAFTRTLYMCIQQIMRYTSTWLHCIVRLSHFLVHTHNEFTRQRQCVFTTRDPKQRFYNVTYYKTLQLIVHVVWLIVRKYPK